MFCGGSEYGKKVEQRQVKSIRKLYQKGAVFFVVHFLLSRFQFSRMSKKRLLSSTENNGNLKQTKLSFSGTQLLVKKSPKKEAPRFMDPVEFFDTAISLLKGTSWMDKLQSELDLPYIKEIFEKLSEETSKVNL